MTARRSARRAFVAAVVATATASALLVPAAPASAEPVVDGYIRAAGYHLVLNGAEDCSYSSTFWNSVSKDFTPATGRRTARFTHRYRATPDDGSPMSAHGRTEAATSGVTEIRGGAFDSVRLTAEHLVRLTDDTATDCGMRLVAQSSGGVDFEAVRGGRVHLEWNRGPTGSFEYISVRRDGDRVFERVRPKRDHGETTFRLRRGGHYTISVFYRLRLSERVVPVGDSETKRTHFRVAAHYLG